MGSVHPRRCPSVSALRQQVDIRMNVYSEHMKQLCAKLCYCSLYLHDHVQHAGFSPDGIQLCNHDLCTLRFHFATLYDTNHRIAVYSAYQFEPSSGGGREDRWFVEPQVTHSFTLFDLNCLI